MKQSIALVGMPGSGKSTVGAGLARRLRCPFVDADQVLEERLGCSIREFFAQQGEAAFRDAEAQVLDELSQGSHAFVLATGGGAVLRQETRQRLHERMVVVYLRAAPEQLLRRVRHDTRRPLLQVADPLKQLRKLHAERDPLYRECAHFVLDTHGLSQAFMVNRIVMQLELASLGDGSELSGGA